MPLRLFSEYLKIGPVSRSCQFIPELPIAAIFVTERQHRAFLSVCDKRAPLSEVTRMFKLSISYKEEVYGVFNERVSTSGQRPSHGEEQHFHRSLGN